MISLSVRAFSELIHLPAYAQLRILNEQKYPKREPQVFKIPFYHVALHGIRSYYKSGGDQRELTTAMLEAGRLNPDSKRLHNERVLRAFGTSSQARRRLQPIARRTLVARPIEDLELRLKFDLVALDGGAPKYIFYNLRSESLDGNVASTALQIAYWVLSENAVSTRIRNIEYIDLAIDRTFAISRQSQKMLKLMNDNAKVVKILWSTI